MSRKSPLLFWITVIAVTTLACGSLQIGFVSPTGTPSETLDQNGIDPIQRDAPTQEVYPPPDPQYSSIPNSSAYPAPESPNTSIPRPGIDLPASLFIWVNLRDNNPDHRAVWRLDPGESEAKMITPTEITAFDIRSVDGRIAYANQDGELLIMMPGEDPRLIYETERWMDFGLEINSLAWSPDGNRLAYSVSIVCQQNCHFENPELIAQPTGVWILNLADLSTTQVLRNIYLDLELNNLNKFRVVREINWAPDGEALLIGTNHFEWNDTYWLSPLAFSDDEANLHQPEQMGWLDASWRESSQSILFSGLGFSSWSDLIQVDRASKVEEVLIDSHSQKPDGIYVSNAQELAGGIAFFMAHSNETGSRLYWGSQDEGSFRYNAAGPERDLCKYSPSEVAWQASGSLAVIACDEAIVRLISLDGIIDTDLAPYFSRPLADLNNTYDLEIYWGTVEE